MRTRPSAAILLSRQSLRPSLSNSWVCRTIEAIEWLKTNDLTLCTSVGMQTWELLTALGALNGLTMEVFMPCRTGDEFELRKSEVVDQFDLKTGSVTFVAVADREQTTDDHKALQQLRDTAIVRRARFLLPVSLRPGGQMERLLRDTADQDSEISRQFEIEYENRREPLGYQIVSSELNPRLEAVGGEYVIHWTRGFNSAWPTERPIDYYRAVIESDRHPRTAFDSLRNIITLELIKSSSDHMPDKTSTVSFSNLPPTRLVELIKWRSRYARMSFEPYGVGIRKALAEGLGIHPVWYYDRKSDNPGIDGVPKWLTQSLGTKTNWSAEQEYRLRGDLSLSDVPKRDLILFCRTPGEVEILEREYGIETIPFIIS